MSLGYGGWCYIDAQDEQTVIYRYGTYNLNDTKFRNKEHICDGMITIDKNSLVEPEIHEKIKRFPNGKKKLIVKRISVDVPYEELFKNKKIEIENSNNCWETMAHGYDFMALRLVFKIFNDYQENGVLPEHISYNV